MKKFYFLFLIFVVQISFAQDFFYKKDASSIPIVGEESLVIFEKPPVNKYEEINAEKSIGAQCRLRAGYAVLCQRTGAQYPATRVRHCAGRKNSCGGEGAWGSV